MEYDPERDTGIAARPLGHLMPTSTVQIVLRSNTYSRPFLLEFIKAIALQLTPGVVRQAKQNFQNARG
jgi:LysR family cys regulon transcriptional activator